MPRPTLLIYSQHGSLLESLAGFLEIAVGAEIVAKIDTLPGISQALAAGVPDLVILDASGINSEATLALKQIKSGWPQACCLVLAENDEQLGAARAAGADEALLWGISTEQLAATVRSLTAEHKLA